jgi:hypothetical protein
MVTLVGDGARLLARTAVDSDVGLILVSARGPRLLRWFGIGFGQRLAGASRVPVLMLPADRRAASALRTDQGHHAEVEDRSNAWPHAAAAPWR